MSMPSCIRSLFILISFFSFTVNSVLAAQQDSAIEVATHRDHVQNTNNLSYIITSATASITLPSAGTYLITYDAEIIIGCNVSGTTADCYVNLNNIPQFARHVFVGVLGTTSVSLSQIVSATGIYVSNGSVTLTLTSNSRLVAQYITALRIA